MKKNKIISRTFHYIEDDHADKDIFISLLEHKVFTLSFPLRNWLNLPEFTDFPYFSP